MRGREEVGFQKEATVRQKCLGLGADSMAPIISKSNRVAFLYRATALGCGNCAKSCRVHGRMGRGIIESQARDVEREAGWFETNADGCGWRSNGLTAPRPRQTVFAALTSADVVCRARPTGAMIQR